MKKLDPEYNYRDKHSHLKYLLTQRCRLELELNNPKGALEVTSTALHLYPDDFGLKMSICDTFTDKGQVGLPRVWDKLIETVAPCREEITTVDFDVVLVAVIFNREARKILLGRRERDTYVSNLTWCFPGGRCCVQERIDDTIVRKVRTKTGIEVTKPKCVFSRIFPENRRFFVGYFLCEVLGGKARPIEDFVELKWVPPQEAERYFTTGFHGKLKNYIRELR